MRHLQNRCGSFPDAAESGYGSDYEIKTMLAEAIVNAMIHGYESRENGTIVLQISYDEEFRHMTVQDEGCGIDDLQLAMQPLYIRVKAYGAKRHGMTIMQTFAVDFHIESEKGRERLSR